jgi:hypothetical protein
MARSSDISSSRMSLSLSRTFSKLSIGFMRTTLTNQHVPVGPLAHRQMFCGTANIVRNANVVSEHSGAIYRLQTGRVRCRQDRLDALGIEFCI